jgi:hypothetical protein
MLVPSDSDLSSKQYEYRAIPEKNGTYTLMPKILECGRDRRKEELNLHQGVSKAKIPNMKWYKMVATYTNPKNNVKQ